MTCKEKIISNDYVDLITDYEGAEQFFEAVSADFCHHEIDEGYGVTNVRRSETPPMSIGYYGYSAIPNLYGLMQVGRVPFNPECLNAMGNIQVQNPPLALQGNGVIIGFIDTGERVIILSGQFTRDYTQTKKRAVAYQSGMRRLLTGNMECAGRYGKDQSGGYAGTDKENDVEAQLL